MPKTTTEKKRSDIWGSVEGIVQKGSLIRDEKGLSAVVRAESGADLQIKGYGAKFSKMIEAAAERGEPVIFRGHVLGSKANDSVHLSVKIEGPAQLTGVISNIRRSAEGKQPFTGFWLINEVTSKIGETHLIPTAVNVYGPEAESLSGMKNGDRVSLEGRNGKDGYIATSPVNVTPGLDQEPPDEPAI